MKEKDMQVCCKGSWGGKGACDAVYGLGLIGSLVFFWQQAPMLGDKVLAVLKALVWPAILVYNLLEFVRV